MLCIRVGGSGFFFCVLFHFSVIFQYLHLHLHLHLYIYFFFFLFLCSRSLFSIVSSARLVPFWYFVPFSLSPSLFRRFFCWFYLSGDDFFWFVFATLSSSFAAIFGLCVRIPWISRGWGSAWDFEWGEISGGGEERRQVKRWEQLIIKYIEHEKEMLIFYHRIDSGSYILQ